MYLWHTLSNSLLELSSTYLLHQHGMSEVSSVAVLLSSPLCWCYTDP
jgi:hypothetical protein